MSRKVKNITVCVTPEIYREARHLAAEYDSTVSALVAWLLPHMRVALERTRFPKGGPVAKPEPACLGATALKSTRPTRGPQRQAFVVGVGATGSGDPAPKPDRAQYSGFAVKPSAQPAPAVNASVTPPTPPPPPRRGPRSGNLEAGTRF